MSISELWQRANRISGRILLHSMVPIGLFLVVLFTVFLPRLEKSAMTAKKAGVRNVVELAMGILENQQAGTMSNRKQTAQDEFNRDGVVPQATRFFGQRSWRRWCQ